MRTEQYVTHAMPHAEEYKMPFLDDLFASLHAHLVERTLHLLRFARYDARMEGWLQGELLNLLVDKLADGPSKLVGVNKASGGARGNRPDFQLEIDGHALILELKVIVGRRGLDQLVRKDVPKLKLLGPSAVEIILAYGLENGQSSWDSLAERLVEQGLQCLHAKAVKQPEFGFLSFWQVT